jgi:voltage-gated potassium channel
MRQLRQRPFLFLLIMLLLLVVVYPTLHETAGSREVYDVLRTLVLIGASRVVFAQRRQFFTGAGLAAVLVASIWIGYLVPGRWALPLVLTLHGLATVFFLVAVGSILWTVYQRSEVSADSLAGALCAYLLLGVVFAHTYWFIETVAPGSFRGDGEFAGELGDPRKSLFALTYYSFVTLASVGANDVAPVRAAARGVTILEAICGQFYIAVLIADLIGKKVSGSPVRATTGGSAPSAGAGGRLSADAMTGPVDTSLLEVRR